MPANQRHGPREAVSSSRDQNIALFLHDVLHPIFISDIYILYCIHIFTSIWYSGAAEGKKLHPSTDIPNECQCLPTYLGINLACDSHSKRDAS